VRLQAAGGERGREPGGALAGRQEALRAGDVPDPAPSPGQQVPAEACPPPSSSGSTAGPSSPSGWVIA